MTISKHGPNNGSHLFSPEMSRISLELLEKGSPMQVQPPAHSVQHLHKGFSVHAIAENKSGARDIELA